MDGNLGGLDTRLWPLWFYLNIVWVGYAIVIGDVWLFLSSLGAALLWFRSCLKALILLSKEEGELQELSHQGIKEGGLYHSGKTLACA